MKRERRRILLISICSASLLLGGCVKERHSEDHAEGTPVVFGASTLWQNEIGDTRTEYSGVDEDGNPVNSGSDFERIDWVPGSDWFSVICAVAGNGPKQDYSVRSKSEAAQNSYANAYSVSGNGLQWGSASVDHYFYAFYPASGMESNYDFGAETTVSESNAKIETYGTNGAKISAVVPAVQKAVKDGNVYKANMNYAYMYAETKINAGSTGAVELDFHPLVTTFEISLKAKVGDVVNSNLTSVELSSTSTNLTGSFQAVLAHGSNPVITPVEGTTGKKITVTVPGEGVRLSTTEAVKFTILSLPVNQADLTLTLYFGSAKRTLALKNRATGAPITVGAGKKAYINNLGVPDTIYFFDVEGPELAFSQDGETRANTYHVTSYKKTLDGTKTPVTWSSDQYEYSLDGGSNWTTSATKPSALNWLTLTESGNGSDTPTGYLVTMSANNDFNDNVTWLGPTAEVGSQSNPVDLSYRNILGEEMPTQSTANCYVVTAPGWYKIPCVYGNAIKNGATYSDAYSNNNNDKSADSPAVQLALKAFKRHDDNAIAGPWIQADNGITLSSASLLWQDASNMISDVSYASQYITFHVAPKQGNAVIAAKKSDGTIVWSWHIWVMDNLDNLRTLTVDNPYSNVPQSKFLAVDLGWTEYGKVADPRIVKVRLRQAGSNKTAEFTLSQQKGISGAGGNILYQWGRKDPIPGGYWAETSGGGANITLKTVYGTYNRTDDSTGQIHLGDGIQHPNQFYYSRSGGSFKINEPTSPGGTTEEVSMTHSSWCSDIGYNLWNADGKFEPYDSNYSTYDIPVVKTVYDPCPVGFKIPNRNAFLVLAKQSPAVPRNDLEPYTGERNDWDNGRFSFDTLEGDDLLIFPRTGLLDTGTGDFRKEGGVYAEFRTFIHTACASNRWNWAHAYQGGMGAVYFQSGTKLVHAAHASGHMAYGMGVRPIADE